MTKILSLALVLVSLNLFSLNSVQNVTETSLVTPAFLQELSENIDSTVKVPEQKKALQNFLRDLKKAVAFYDADRDQENYLTEDQTFRFIKNTDKNYPFQALYLSEPHTWNQSRSQQSIIFSELSLNFVKYSVRSKKANKKVADDYKNCKIWIFILTRGEVSECFVYCERGLFTKSTDLTLVNENYPAQAEEKVQPRQENPKLSSYDLNQQSDFLQDLFPEFDLNNVTEPEISLDELLSEIRWEEEPSVQSNAMVVPYQDNYSLDEITLILSQPLGHLLQVYGHEQVADFINWLGKENTLQNPTQFPQTKLQSAIQKPRSHRR